MLVRFIWVLVANAIALGVTAWLLDGVVVDDRLGLVLAALVFGIVNTIIKPIITILGIPLIIITLGIALFFINMLMLAITDGLIDGFDIEGFWTYVGATFLVWLVNFLLEYVPPFRRE